MSGSIGILAANGTGIRPAPPFRRLERGGRHLSWEFGTLDTLVSSEGVSSLAELLMTTNGSSPRRA